MSPLVAFLFGSPISLLLTGAGAVSIPIVIHLLNRKRYRTVTWAAMRFLLAAEKKNARRLRIEQLLLLAVRVLLVLLLVLAMAAVTDWAEDLWATILPENTLFASSAGRRTHRILVIDGSFSMGARNGETTCFEKARQVARQIVRDSQPGDGYSIILMTEPPRRLIGAANGGPGPSELIDKVLAELETMRMPHGNSDLGRTLETVADVVKQSPGKFLDKEVYFLTDLQRATWLLPQPGELTASLQGLQAQHIRTTLIDVGAGISPSNRAVTSVSLGAPVALANTDTPILATLYSHGPDSSDQVKVSLRIGRAPVAVGDPPFQILDKNYQMVPLTRGENLVSFKYRFPSAGEYLVQVRMEADGQELDDVRSTVVTVRENIPVMVVNGKPAPALYDQATEYLLDALNPFTTEGAAPQTSTPVKVRTHKVSAAEFADAGLGDLTNFDCVFLCDVPRLSLSEQRRLEAHVRRGGGVVFSLGSQVDLAAYNEVLYRNGQGLLPARLLGRQRAPQGYTFHFAPDEQAFREPPLAAFRLDRERARLLSVPFFEYVRSELPTRTTARKVLSFLTAPETPGKQPAVTEDERAIVAARYPAVLAWHPPLRSPDRKPAESTSASLHVQSAPQMRGRVALLTSTVNADWTEWPKQGNFVWFMQELLYHVSAGRLREQAVDVGTPLEAFLTLPTGETEITLHTPEGRSESTQAQVSEETTLLRWIDTDVSGVYRAVIGQHPQEYLFAVNVPRATPQLNSTESNPERTSAEEIRKSYPEWDLQVLNDPSEALRSQRPVLASGGERMRQVGSGLARWLLLMVLALLVVEVILAWFFGHYSAAPSGDQRASLWPATTLGTVGKVAWCAGMLVLGVTSVALAGIVLHAAWTGDLLSFMPDSFRQGVERALDIPPPAPGEGSRWHLEFLPYLWNRAADPWIVVPLFLGLGVLVVWLYQRESVARTGTMQGSGGVGLWMASSALRLGMLLLTLGVLLPQLRLWFERQSWPDVVLLIDDSASMGEADAYRDPRVKAMAEQLMHLGDLKQPERLTLAQVLLTRGEQDWITELMVKRQVKVHVYHCSARASRLSTVTTASERDDAIKAILGLQASERHDSSQLGSCVRQVLNDFRGSALSAIIMITDGNTTEGEDLQQAAKYAAQLKVPLYFLGMGDAQESRDLSLHDLEVADTVFVGDTLVFNLSLTGKGYPDLAAKVRLVDKATGKELAAQQVAVDPAGVPVKVRFDYRPTEAGEKTFILETPPQPDEVDRENNRLERTVLVSEVKLIKVLYIEGYARWEYRFIKTLLERESARLKNNKTVELKVLLLDADAEYAAQDKSALPDFPTKAELNQFDVVILGDVDPRPRDNPRMNQHLQDLADFVRVRGGGLLMIAGERFAPNAYKDTPLKDILPIDILDDHPVSEPEEGLLTPYRPELTPIGRMHPIFSFNEKDAEQIWNHLHEFYWAAQGYVPKRAAEVLATHPTRKAQGLGTPARGSMNKQPLVVQQFVGAGRSLFYGFHETWRWRWREDELRFNQFWIQTVRYLASNRQGRVELRLDRQTPYRRGEPIKVTVRFPDDSPAPSHSANIRVQMDRRVARDGEQETRTVKLAYVEGSRGTFEGLITRTPVGQYHFELVEPPVAAPKPRADCKVLAPPGEKEQLRMNQVELRNAANTSQGGFYTLDDAAQLLDDLPGGTRVTLSTPGPPWLVWNHPLMFGLAILFLSSEWILRKLRHLL